MKYYKNLIDALLEILVDTEQYPADKVLERVFKKNKKWGSRDRRFVAETLFEMVRWKRLLQTVAIEDSPLGMWQCYTVWKGQPLPDFYSLSEEKIRRIKDCLAQETRREVRQSVTDWFDSKGFAQWGDDWNGILTRLNLPAPVFLRPNGQLANIDQLKRELKNEGIESEVKDRSLVLLKRQNVFRTECFKRGWFEVQDFGSQQIARFLDPQPGERVIDACAGAGGKTLHMADLMNNQGKIIALDIHQWKLTELKLRARRAKVPNIESKLIEGSKTIKRLAGKADRLLLDVPCSGSGVLRRNPDSKWKLSETRFKELIEIQQNIIANYSSMLKPGGTLVYSTCSIFEEENQRIVDAFLESNSLFQKVDECTLLPEVDGGDGFYMAKMVRNQ